MWKIKEIKQKAKKTLKRNIWTLTILGLFMTSIVGEYLVNRDGYSNIKIIYEYIQNKGKQQLEPQEILINEYVDKAISQLFTGNMTKSINYYNEKHNVTKGVIFSIFNIYTKGQAQVQNIFNSIANYKNKEAMASIILIIASIISAVVSKMQGENDYIDSIIIIGIVIFNSLMGVIQEAKAEKSIEALKKMTPQMAKIIRDGKTKEIKSNELTLGEEHVHEWVEATCTAPKTCKTCGATEGEALGHDWKEATTEAPKTCTRCGATEGEKLPTEKPKKNCKKTSLISILVSLTVLAGCLVIRKKHN